MNTKADNRVRSLPPTLARLPPLTALRAFVATARHLSFSRAADELHVTSAAIGQQIRLLENYVGEPLFLRLRGQLELTPTGLTLKPGLTEAFDRVLDTMARVTTDRDPATSVRAAAAAQSLVSALHPPRPAAVSVPVVAAE